VSRAAALAASCLVLVACSDAAEPVRRNAPDVRPELALLTAGLPLAEEEATCREPDDPGCPHLDLRAGSTSSPDRLLGLLAAELRRQRWVTRPSSCRGTPRACAVTASKAGTHGTLTLNFIATAEKPGATSVRISVFYP
jgi:hypothetical protein